MQQTSALLANLVLVMFLLFVFFCGAGVGYIALSDSDTCWLLAMGRWIIEHDCLPFIDPFSSGIGTYAAIKPGLPLVQYQWLAEIILYGTYKLIGLAGLSSLVSLLVCFTFFIVPYSFFQKSGSPRILSLIVISIGALLSSIRWEARPHIFSFLFMAVLIYLYIPTHKTFVTSKSKTIATAIIMFFWANTHIYFPLGIIFLSVIALATLSEKVFICRQRISSYLSVLWLPIVAFLATCINPWGLMLWAYVYRLWSAPNNYLLTELSPFNILLLSNRYFIMLMVLIVVYIGSCLFFRIRSFRQWGVLSPSLVATGLYAGLNNTVLIPATTLFMTAGLAELINRQNKESPKPKWTQRITPFLTVEKDLQRIIPSKNIWLNTLLTTMLSGTLICCYLFPPTLPSTQSSSETPIKAINFLKHARPSGKVFNDPIFGSMMIWYLPKPDVFFDSRFSQYDPDRMLEYIHIYNCDPGYEKIWARYDFDWVFIKSISPLTSVLRKLGWRTIYEDRTAIIMTKQ